MNIPPLSPSVGAKDGTVHVRLEGTQHVWTFEHGEETTVCNIKNYIRNDAALRTHLILGRGSTIFNSPEKIPPGRYWVQPCPSSEAPGRPPVPALPFECVLTEDWKDPFPILNQTLAALCQTDKKVVVLDSNVFLDLVGERTKRKRASVARRLMEILQQNAILPVLTTTVVTECNPTAQQLETWKIATVCSTPRSREFFEEMDCFVKESRLHDGWKVANYQDFRNYAETLFLKRHLGSRLLALVSSNLRFATKLSVERGFLKQVYQRYTDLKPVPIWSLGDAINHLEESTPEPLRESQWACWKCRGEHHDPGLCLSSIEISDGSHQDRCAVCFGTGHSPDHCARHSLCFFCRASGHLSSSCTVKETQYHIYHELREKITTLEQTNLELRNLVEELKLQVSETQGTNNRLQIQNESLRQRISELENSNSKFTAQNDTLRNRVNALKNTSALLQKRLKEVGNTTNQLNQQNGSLKQRIAELKKKNAELKQQNAELKKKNVELRKRNRDIQNFFLCLILAWLTFVIITLILK
ncbi:hypothetical protein QOT17_011271 [Balamuthia mandrillaris]